MGNQTYTEIRTNDLFKRYKKIDMHSHIGKRGEPFNIEADKNYLIREMDTYNIEKTVICSTNAFDHSEVIDAYNSYPDRFIKVARIDCSKGKETYDLLEHLLRDEKFMGAKIQALFDGYASDAPCVDVACEICEQYNVPFYVHSGHEPFSLPWQIGLLAERHPKLKIVMLHMGHGHGIYVDAAIKMAKRYENIWLETSGTSMSVQIKNAYENVDRERIMFGIDTPFHEPSVEIQKIMASGIDEKGIMDILYNNAYKFLHS